MVSLCSDWFSCYGWILFVIGGIGVAVFTCCGLIALAVWKLVYMYKRNSVDDTNLNYEKYSPNDSWVSKNTGKDSSTDFGWDEERRNIPNTSWTPSDYIRNDHFKNVSRQSTSSFGFGEYAHGTVLASLGFYDSCLKEYLIILKLK